MAARWVVQAVEDLSARLPQIPAPTLLLWGGADPISPSAVGERLRDLLPAARLCILADAGHDLAQTHTATVADQIRRHLDAAGGVSRVGTDALTFDVEQYSAMSN